MTLHDYYYKSINADLRLLNNTLMSYSNDQSGDWLPRCILKHCHLILISKRNNVRQNTVLPYDLLKP